MKTIQNLLKRYFIFVDQRFLGGAVFVAFVFFCLYAIIASLFGLIFYPAEKEFPILAKGIYVSTIFAIVLIMINVFVTARRVLSFPEDKTRVILIYPPEGKVQFYEKPVWKMPYRIIKMPIFPASLINELKIITLRLNLEINMAGEIILVPFICSIYYAGKFKAEELDKMISDYNPDQFAKTYDFSQCIWHVFNKTNCEGKRLEKLKEIATKWMNNEINFGNLKKEAKKIVSFPNNLFTNAAIELNLYKRSRVLRGIEITEKL